MHVCILHAWLLSILQVFKAQRKGSLEGVFAAKRITVKDSDKFDTQTEVSISHTDVYRFVSQTFIMIDGDLIFERNENIAAM